MSNERPIRGARSALNDNGDIRFVDDLSEDAHSDALPEMDIDSEDILLEEDELLGDAHEARHHHRRHNHEQNGDDEDYSDAINDDDDEDNNNNNDVDDDDDEDDDGDDDDDEDTSSRDMSSSDERAERTLQRFLSHGVLSSGVRETLERYRRGIPVMDDDEEWAHRRDGGGDEEEEEEEEDEEEHDDMRVRISPLDSLHSFVSNSPVVGIMHALRSQDVNEILTGLNELSNLLLIPSRGIEAVFLPMESLSAALVSLLRTTDTIEVQVMVARAMSQLIDAGFPTNPTKALINAGVIPVMKRMFENVFYIDLIEQLIHVVKPVAVAEPRLVLESGCLLPCVTTLDFFNDYIQRETMAAIDACAKDVTPENSEQAKNLLAAFPESPNDTVIGTYSLLIIAIAKLNEPQFDEIVTQQMWDNLVLHIQPGTPHIARIMRAVAHVAARCPKYATNFDMLAHLVHHTLVQDSNGSSADLFTKLISVSKDSLFAGLKLLQVLLPLPPTIGKFSGPYRKDTTTTKQSANQQQHPALHEKSGEAFSAYASTAVPLAMAAYSASTNTPVRQLAILVVMQVVTLLRHRPEFVPTVLEMGLVPFVAQVISEEGDHLALTVGGLDIVWDLISDQQLLVELSNSGISSDLEQYVVAGSTDEPTSLFSPADDLTSVASYMSSSLLQVLREAQGNSGDLAKLVESVRLGDFDVKQLLSAPLPELIKAGLLEALECSDITNHLSDDLVVLLQSAVTRLERFELQLTGSRAKSIEEVLTRAVYVRLTERSGEHPERSWAVSVSAIAALRSLEDFIRRMTSPRLFASTVRFPPPPSARISPESSGDRFSFWIGDQRLPSDISVLKAIQNQGHSHGQGQGANGNGSSGHGAHGGGTPVIKFQKIEDLEEEEHAQAEIMAEEKQKNSIKEPIATALRLLRKLAEENERRGEPVSWELFRSSKLTAKLSRQLADVLAIAASLLPQWTFDTVHEYPFLYSLKVRLHFVQLTSFGMGRNLRLLRRMQQDSDDNDDDILPDDDESNQILGRHKHQKYRLSRESVLKGALELLDMSSKNPAVVEVMFYGEEGTGKGPTQEFFVLASQALSSLSLGMWRLTPAGLYPESNLDPSDTVLRNFKGMGMLIARALLDKRILDFHLNPAFFEAVLSSTGPNVEKLRRVDSRLAGSLDKLLDTSAKDLQNIGLDFTLPGTDIELLPSGKDIDVTAENVGDYVNLVCDYIVGSGIQKQIDAFRQGFSDTIPISALNSFMLDELATLCGADRDEDWSISTLRDAITADHGYNSSSVPVQQLFNILSQFEKSERRKFLMFATGSPHLPVGGFKALTPAFTVVIKHPDNEELEPDQYLPSVMTCANYFKLPSYSSEEIMRRQLKLAMSEGSDAFLLS